MISIFHFQYTYGVLSFIKVSSFWTFQTKLILHAILDFSALNSLFRSHYKEVVRIMQILFASFLYIEKLKKGANKMAICRETVKYAILSSCSG